MSITYDSCRIIAGTANPGDNPIRIETPNFRATLESDLASEYQDNNITSSALGDGIYL